MGHHDSTHRRLFAHPFMVEALLRGFLPGDWIRQLDFNSLRRWGEGRAAAGGRTRRHDTVWCLKRRGDGEPLYVYPLLEFQSDDPPFMAVRMGGYVVLTLQDIIDEQRLGRGDRLPVILPIVLYNGRGRWRSERQLARLFELHPEELTPYRCQCRYLLLDAGAFDPAQLAAMENPVACLFRLEGSTTPADAPAAIEALISCLPGEAHDRLRRDFVRWLIEVYLPTRLPDTPIPQVKKLEEVSAVIHENLPNWTDRWIKQGMEQGLAEGLVRGRREGRQEGEAALLLRLLHSKFGTLDVDARQRIEGADADQLLSWGERLLEVDSLDELFRNGTS